jgi:hypothetical protein
MSLEQPILFRHCLDGILMFLLWLQHLDHSLLPPNLESKRQSHCHSHIIPSTDFDICYGTLARVYPFLRWQLIVALDNKAVIRTGWTVVGLSSVTAIALAVM